MQRSLIYFYFRYLGQKCILCWISSFQVMHRILSLCIAVYHCFPLPSGQRPAHLRWLRRPHTCPPLSLAHLVSLPFQKLSSESIFCFFTGFSLYSPCMCLHRSLLLPTVFFRILLAAPGKPPLTVSFPPPISWTSSEPPAHACSHLPANAVVFIICPSLLEGTDHTCRCQWYILKWYWSY